MAIAELDLQPLGQRIDDRSANAVQTAGDLVSAAAELAAGVQDGKDNGDRRDAQLWLDADRDASTVILDTDDIARQQVDQNLGTVSCQDLVDGIVHNLIDQVVQAAHRRRADVHARALAHRLQPLEHLNFRGVVVIVFIHRRGLQKFVVCHGVLLVL